jgi:MYXO-CTERM domain-containing protein
MVPRQLASSTLRSMALPVIVVLGVSSSASAETYYVAESGDDDQSGLAGEPWQTLQRAADAVVAGDVVNVASGTYAGFYLEASGTESAPIHFVAEPGVVIDEVNPTTPDGINVENTAWVIVEGFEVQGMSRAGLRCAESQHITFRGNVSRDNGSWGILTGFCDDFVAERNDCSGSLDEHGIYVSNSADRPVIRHNRLWNNNANGLHMNGDASLGGDGVIDDAIVEGNVIFGNGAAGGSGINCDGCQRALIQNNLIYDTHASGISLYAIDAAQGSHDNVVANNTVIVASDGRWALNIQDGSTNNRAFNNILLNDNPSSGAIDISADSLDGFVSDYNVVTDRFTSNGGDSVLTLSSWSASGDDTNSIVADSSALFVAAVRGDYHLREASPGIDSGTTPGAPATDLEGVSRPQAGAVDIGAYEYCPGDCGPTGSGGSGGSSGSGAGDSRGEDTRSSTQSGCSCTTPEGERSVGWWWLLAALPFVRQNPRSPRRRP